METAASRPRLGAEVLIVLGLSLGQSGIYAVVNLLVRLTAATPLAQQKAGLNQSVSPRPYVDLTYQLLGVAFALVPVALALYLLSTSGRAALARIGCDRARPWRDLATGVGLAALIGIPGLAFYLFGRWLGITVQVNPAGLGPYWWAVPVLILAALKNAVVEEIIAVGYLLERLEQMGWHPLAQVAASALLRGSYHLYQGVGPGIGNVVMGVVFAEFYRRRRRTLPLIIAHTLIDVVAFVGFLALPASWIAQL